MGGLPASTLGAVCNLKESVLQDRLTQCRQDQFAGEFDGDVALVEEGIDLDYFEGSHSAVGGDYLEGEMGFAIGRAAADQRARAGGETRIDHVDVKRHGVTAGSLRSDRHRVLDAFGHPTPVDVTHREEIVAKSKLFDLRTFAGIDITSSDVGEVFGVELWSVAAQIDEFGVRRGRVLPRAACRGYCPTAMSRAY